MQDFRAHAKVLPSFLSTPTPTPAPTPYTYGRHARGATSDRKIINNTPRRSSSLRKPSLNTTAIMRAYTTTVATPAPSPRHATAPPLLCQHHRSIKSVMEDLLVPVNPPAKYQSAQLLLACPLRPYLASRRDTGLLLSLSRKRCRRLRFPKLPALLTLPFAIHNLPSSCIPLHP